MHNVDRVNRGFHLLQSMHNEWTMCRWSGSVTDHHECTTSGWVGGERSDRVFYGSVRRHGPAYSQSFGAETKRWFQWIQNRSRSAQRLGLSETKHKREMCGIRGTRGMLMSGITHIKVCWIDYSWVLLNSLTRCIIARSHANVWLFTH